MKNITETTSNPPFNRRAVIGFIVAILSLLSFCAGFAPIPFTAIICYPISIVLGVTAFVFGLSSSRQIRANGENGKTFAAISIWTGSFVILTTICFITLGILLWPHMVDLVKQTWQQLKVNGS